MRILNLLLLVLSTAGGSAQDRSDRPDASTATCQAPVLGADALVGSWDGALGEPPAAVALSLAFARAGDAWSGTFSVVSDGIRDFPLHSVDRDGDEVTAHFTPQRVFRGTVRGDSIPGSLTFHDRNDLRMEVTLHRSGSPGWERLQRDLERWREEQLAAPAPGLSEGERGPAWSRVDASALARLLKASEESRSSAVVILKGGELVGRWHDPRGARPIEAMSVTKSVLSLAVGRLLALGLLESMDVPVHQYYPEWREGGRSRITVRHLLNHTSGISTPMPATPIYESGDFVRFALEAELESEPGTEFVYNNNATNLLAGVIGKAAGVRTDRFIGAELFGPLGITEFTWSLDRAGNPHGMAGLQIHAADLARLGQLVLQDGVWEEERLLPEGWVARSLRPGSDLSPGAGLLWWLIRDGDQVVGARADGYLGQYLVLYPESGLVGVRMIEGSDSYDQARDGFARFQELLRELR
jgi:CubicO group peptidase (beta-lactamase class C family)